ncbi:MAG: TonB-dependent receptor [Acidobacteriota bacterium]
MSTVLKQVLVFAICCLLSAPLRAQTIQGVISGRLVNSLTGRPMSGASVTFTSSGSATSGSSLTDSGGYYALPLLSPGTYRVRATAADYQAQEVQELELAVASRIDLSFRLRPLSDVWEAGQTNSVFLPGSRTIVTFFGPDVDATKTGSFEANKGRLSPLETTVSEVIRASDIADLPLAGRDAYTMLVTQPGVTSDGATARGLGLAANGQRPSASNFLLDGLENNNYLTTGPLVPVAPQAIQEYRVSTNNYSAEYGRTSGFVANAITRSGANQFHGTAYYYLKNESLDANGFQENRLGVKRSPHKEVQAGFWLGGPLRRDRLFFSSAFEYFRSRGQQDPQKFTLPNVPALSPFLGQGRQSTGLLNTYAPPSVSGTLTTGTATIAPPVSIHRKLAIERLDWNPGSKDRINGSLLLSRADRPDFIWTPYPDFVSGLNQNNWRLGGSEVHTFSPKLINEARLGFSNDDLHWDRPHPEIPTLAVSDGTVLPGSPAFYAYKNVNKSLEVLDNVTWSTGAHRVTMGAGALLRSSDGYQTAGRDGQYLFTNVLTFALDRPTQVRAAIDRATVGTGSLAQPDSNRQYRYQQYFAFAQDTFRVSRRLTVNYGLRYELFGAPRNTGTVKDSLVVLGAGNDLASELTTAHLQNATSGGQRLFGTDTHDVAVRAGASYDLFGTGRTLLRASYGVFYDRPYDNLWQNVRNNDFSLPLLSLTASSTQYLGPVTTVLNTFAGKTLNANFPSASLIDPNLKNGRVQSYFAGVQQRFTSHTILEINAQGAYGRNLITTDIINRDFSTADPASTTGRYNSSLPDIAYRSGQGFSNYNALTAAFRHQSGRGTLHIAYTWSHAIDNQSDALTGDFFNLTFASIQTSPGSNGRAAFSRQFDPQSDRGNADFDQRHNLVAFYAWNVPGPHLTGFSGADRVLGLFGRDWLVSGIAAVRSGMPVNLRALTDTAGKGQGFILNNRPNMINAVNPLLSRTVATAGGERLLFASSFGNPAPSTLGNVGRNALTGPGFYNLDLALARSFVLGGRSESARLQFRADVFNLLNHANLGNPDTLLSSPNFGIAQYGRSGTASGFPAVGPLVETARQVQLSIQLRF